MDDFAMFFSSTVVPLASYNADLATTQADRILREFSHELILLAGKDKINQCGLINLWLDYLALNEYISTQQKQSQLLVIDTMGGPQQVLRIVQESILELKVVSEFFMG